MRNIRAIRNEADYDWALAEIAHYFENQPAPGTVGADRFDVLASLIEAYEAKHWPIESTDPVEAIEYRMEISGYTQKDLSEFIGSRSRASEILKRKRPFDDANGPQAFGRVEYSCRSSTQALSPRHQITISSERRSFA